MKKMTNQHNRQTRNQRKREAMRTAALTAAVVFLFAVLTVWALGIWAEHPGEQPVSGRDYMSSMSAE